MMNLTKLTGHNLLAIIFTTTIIFSCTQGGRKEKMIEQNIALTHLFRTSGLIKIVSGIEKGNTVESSHIGETNVPSRQWEKYEQLKRTASADQLIQLTDYKNPAVRCYAFQALAAKGSDKIFDILLNHLNDTSKVERRSGCIGWIEFSGDYFIDVVTTKQIDEDVYKLNRSERKILDSILLNNTSIRLSAKSSVIENLKPTVNNYQRIRKLVEVDRNEFAVSTLAKYKKQADKELIASFFRNEEEQYAALYAVREFPDEYFFAFVKDIFEQEWKKESYDYSKWRICYQVLAKYPRAETVELLNKATMTKDTFRYTTLCKYLLVAITKYPNKLYNPIKEKIKLDNFHMDEVKDELENDY